ncbi:MAG: hypothetical protein QXV17_00010 [Candidatus Micrarchaeaceae archaeon]
MAVKSEEKGRKIDATVRLIAKLHNLLTWSWLNYVTSLMGSFL